MALPRRLCLPRFYADFCRSLQSYLRQSSSTFHQFYSRAAILNLLSAFSYTCRMTMVKRSPSSILVACSMISSWNTFDRSYPFSSLFLCIWEFPLAHYNLNPTARFAAFVVYRFSFGPSWFPFRRPNIQLSWSTFGIYLFYYHFPKKLLNPSLRICYTHPLYRQFQPVLSRFQRPMEFSV